MKKQPSNWRIFPCFPELSLWPKIENPCWNLDLGTLCYIYSVYICLFDYLQGGKKKAVYERFIEILYSGAPEEGVTKGVVFNLKRSRIKIGPWHTSQRSYKRRSSDSTYFYQQPFLWGLLLLHNCTDIPLYDSAPENITFHGHVLPKRNKTLGSSINDVTNLTPHSPDMSLVS